MPMNPIEIARVVSSHAHDADRWHNSLAADRIRAIEYYDGTMSDTPSEPTRSSVVSLDFRAATKKVLPAITRVILGGDSIGEYQPVARGGEDTADQASDYVNYVVLPECNGVEVIHDAIHDALRVRNGLIKWWWDRSIDVKFTRHSGLDQDELAVLSTEQDAEVTEQEQGADGLFSCKVKRIVRNGMCRIACIPAEEFRINMDAVSIEDAVFVAHVQRLRRNQLIRMGYDPNVINELPATTESMMNRAERTTRTPDQITGSDADNVDKQLEQIDYWECFVRIDADGDGISEMRRIVMAGGFAVENILENDEVDEAPFSDLVIERRPHEWQGRALFDDVGPIQRVKTVLLRNTLDNIYWQNNLQPIVNMAAVENPDAVLNPKFGQPIRISAGTSPAEAVTYNQVPFVAAESFKMLGYMDEEIKDRTGITDASAGLSPDALQNQTATATALLEQQGISQVETMVRSVAVGLRKVFKGILKIVVQHQDKPRTIIVRGKWVNYDPRAWNADMEFSVNIGLGAGSRERDMQALQTVVGLQAQLLGNFGPINNPFVTADNLYNALAKLIASAGLRHVDQFITKPTPEAIQQFIQQKQSAPNPEMIKAQAQMQVEQHKTEVQTQATMRIEQAKIMAQRDKEAAQAAADLQVKQAEMEKNAVAEAQKIQLEREKMAQERELRIAELAQQREIEMRKLSLAQMPTGEHVIA